ncbi:MAG: tandem-95 repeat protein, partial [Deltaproteobacteria bacterium]|nr:tandem-95 repeat protein [Deltaproteobacteria bacterium]
AGAVTFIAQVTDGRTKVDLPVTVDVAAVNDAPTLSGAKIDGAEDQQLTAQLRGSDVDSDTLTYELRRAPKHGTATVDPSTGLLTYTPEPDWNGAVAATVRVSDGRASADVEVPITIAAVNDPPVARPLRLALTEDSSTSEALEVSDPDRDKLSFAVKTAPTKGEATVDTRGRVTYRRRRNENGVDKLIVAVADGTVTVDVAVDVAIEAVNDAPVSTTAAPSFAEDTTLQLTLTANDVDGDKLRFRAGAAPSAGGQLSISSMGELRWSPPPDFHGHDKLGFEVDDGAVRTEVMLPVTVTPVNDPPTLKVKSAWTREDTPTTTEAEFADIDGDKLSLRIERQGEKSTAAIDGARVLVTPTPDQWGKDTIVVAVDDGTTSTTANLAVTIEQRSDPPLVRDERLTTNEDTVAEATLPATDPDDDPLTFQLTSTGTLGTATLLDARTGRVAYTPRGDAFGDDVIGFVVNDGVDDRRHRVVGRLMVTIKPVDDAPVAADAEIETTEDTPVRATVTMNDVDGDALTLALAAPPANATVVVEDGPRGVLAVTPARDFFGQLAVSVLATETASGRLRSTPATVRVTVKPVNDAPATGSLSLHTAEDTPLEGQPLASDIDRDTLRWAVTKQPAAGSVTMDAQTGKFTYTPRKNTYGNDGFVFVVDDGNGGTAGGRVDVAVSPVDDPPVGIPGELAAPRNGRAAGKLQGRDPEGDPLTFRIVDEPATGSVKLLDEKTGDYAFSVQGGTKGSMAPFRFVVEAGGKTSEPVTVVVRIE